MSTAKLESMEHTGILGTCIVKATDMRPALLAVEKKDEHYVAVRGIHSSPRDTLWMPLEIVFIGDRELFDKLRAAYEDGDITGLLALWNEALPWTAGAN